MNGKCKRCEKTARLFDGLCANCLASMAADKMRCEEDIAGSFELDEERVKSEPIGDSLLDVLRAGRMS